VDLDWNEENWEDISQEESKNRLDSFLEEDRNNKFDLTKAPLFRRTISIKKTMVF